MRLEGRTAGHCRALSRPPGASPIRGVRGQAAVAAAQETRLWQGEALPQALRSRLRGAGGTIPPQLLLPRVPGARPLLARGLQEIPHLLLLLLTFVVINTVAAVLSRRVQLRRSLGASGRAESPPLHERHITNEERGLQLCGILAYSSLSSLVCAAFGFPHSSSDILLRRSKTLALPVHRTL